VPRLWDRIGEGGVSGPSFDIFSGESEQDAVWVECVEGLSAAQERMKQIAELAPGRYFLFSVQDHIVLARIETFSKSKSA
jgi:hypothetical protein